MLAASNIRPDGYHPEITAPEQDDPRLPTEAEFAIWKAAYEAVAPNPDDLFPFLERLQPVVHDMAGWTAEEIRSITAPTFLVIGDRTSSASTTPPRCSTSSPTAGSPSCPTPATPRSWSAPTSSGPSSGLSSITDSPCHRCLHTVPPHDERNDAMSERDGYIPGVPCWVDTNQTDPAKAAEFYRGLFGWELEDSMPEGAEAAT